MASTWKSSFISDGCMDGWIGGWVYGRMDGWVGGWVDGWMDGWVGGWMDGWVGVWKGGWVDGWMSGYMDGWMFELTVGFGIGEGSKRSNRAYCSGRELKEETEENEWWRQLGVISKSYLNLGMIPRHNSPIHSVSSHRNSPSPSHDPTLLNRFTTVHNPPDSPRPPPHEEWIVIMTIKGFELMPVSNSIQTECTIATPERQRSTLSVDTDYTHCTALYSPR